MPRTYATSGRRTRSKQTKVLQTSSSENLADQTSKNDLVINKTKEINSSDEEVPLQNRTKSIRKTRTKVCESQDGDTKTKGTVNLNENSEANNDIAVPAKRKARTKTKKSSNENSEEKPTRKSKRQKTDSLEINSATNVDNKSVIDNDCLEELSEKNDDMSNVHNETVTINSFVKQHKALNEITEERDEDAINNNDINDNVPHNILLATDDLTQVNNNLASSSLNTNSSRAITSEPTKSSNPSLAMCSIKLSRITPSHLIDIKDNNNEVKPKISETDNYVKAPCHCNGKIQCYGPYSEGSYGTLKLIGQGIEIKKLLKHEKSIMAGFVKINTYSFMAGKATNNTVYFVVNGKLRVTLADNVKNVNVDDCFMIINGTEYEIMNIGKEPARLSFVKTSKLL